MRISDWSSDVCSSDLDEVEIEVERAQHHSLARPFSAPVMGIFGLQPLRVIVSQAGKDQHADEPNYIMNRGRLQPDIDQARNEQADNAHDQERSEEHTSELQSLMRNSYAVL